MRLRLIAIVFGRIWEGKDVKWEEGTCLEEIVVADNAGSKVTSCILANTSVKILGMRSSVPDAGRFACAFEGWHF